MNDIEELLYEEIKGMRQDLKDNLESIDNRLTILETFRNYILGGFAIISIVAGCTFEYIKERFI